MTTKTLKVYYHLTKPGIIYANALTAIAGYLFGSAWRVDISTFLAVVVGTSLVIAGACVYNNVIDRRIDKQMLRTRQRALVTGAITPMAGTIYATVLTIVGFSLLALFTNVTVVVVGVIGIIDYVILYGWTKRHTQISTIVGSISGATSILAGYTAAVGHFDSAGALLFLILTIWQMPHFYAIAMYRKRDYAAAHLPLMPSKHREAIVKARILAYIVALMVVSVLLTTTGFAGVLCMTILLLLSGVWLLTGVSKYHLESAVWGKQMFLVSLVVNLGISVAIAIGSVTP
ncbi:protoheme IX farnesyltransferase [Aeromicrobium sp.]|nr:protoheme IX farnesyltransferase [Candidatus Saccharibacteria bacterium]